jgi:hypothetical protein
MRGKQKRKSGRKDSGKDNFTFGEILGDSISEYGKNFREILKFMFVFVGIPALIFGLIELIAVLADPMLFNILSNPELLSQIGNTIKLPIYYRLGSYLFGAITIFLSLFITVGFINTSLRKNRFSYRELLRNGNLRYWNFFVFNIVFGIFLVLLFLALIIPGIIFGVYWVFACYIFLDKKYKIGKSLKESKRMIKGRWWKTFGYILLVFIILSIFSLAANIVQLPTFMIYMIHMLNNTPMSLGFLITAGFLKIVAGFISSLIVMPLGILFFKNYYLRMKKIKA